MDRQFNHLPDRHPDDVAPGDLVFCTKSSRMHDLLRSVGDPWRHVALIIEGDQGPAIGEVSGRHRFRSRSLTEAMEFYDEVAVARPSAVVESCRRQAIDYVVEHLDKPNLYAWDDVLLVGMILATRRGLSTRRLALLAEALQAAADRAPQATQPSMTCSAFVFEAFDRTEGCRLSVPITPSEPSLVLQSHSDLPSLDELAELDPDRFDQLLADASLHELLLADLDGRDGRRSSGAPVDLGDLREPTAVASGHSGSQASVSQVVRAIRVVGTLINAYAREYRGARPGSITPGQLDGRWVSPGDLWRSDSVTGHAYLKAAPAR